MKILNLGLQEYKHVYDLQLKIVDDVLHGGEDTLIVCTHFPVVTLGRKSEVSDVWGWDGDIVTIERGGKATFHGPGQIILYPIINLKNYGKNLEAFLISLEESVVNTLISYGVSATGNPNRNNPSQTGVWVHGLKIASVGVAVKSWVTYHGMALNFSYDENAFKGINPCGKNGSVMTSVEQETDLIPERYVFEESLASCFINLISKYKESKASEGEINPPSELFFE